MKIARSVSTLGVILSLVSHQAVQAADSVYLGDCTRAQLVMQESTIDELLPHSRYEGIQRMYDGEIGAANCPPDRVLTYTLTARSRSSDVLVFDATRLDFIVGARPSGCNAPYRTQNGLITGTATFKTVLAQKGELCELYIWADFDQYIAGDANWSGDFSNRLVSLSGGSFVMSQPSASGSKFTTPIAFTGANR